ncbi:MAG: hypothetical protein ABII71_02465 [Candidatus Micrarchaeota archaeon]
MYTTSRYASLETRRLARRLSGDNGEIYLSRGKKTVRDLVLLARRRGEESISIIGEKGKIPSTLSRLEVLGTGGWKWKGKKEL